MVSGLDDGVPGGQPPQHCISLTHAHAEVTEGYLSAGEYLENCAVRQVSGLAADEKLAQELWEEPERQLIDALSSLQTPQPAC